MYADNCVAAHKDHVEARGKSGNFVLLKHFLLFLSLDYLNVYVVKITWVTLNALHKTFLLVFIPFVPKWTEILF